MLQLFITHDLAYYVMKSQNFRDDTIDSLARLRLSCDLQLSRINKIIQSLKMPCPNTGFIHFLRVSPDINSSREAITCIN